MVCLGDKNQEVLSSTKEAPVNENQPVPDGASFSRERHVYRQTVNRDKQSKAPVEGSVLALLGPIPESFMPGVVDFKIHTGPSPPPGWKRSKAVL